MGFGPEHLDNAAGSVGNADAHDGRGSGTGHHVARNDYKGRGVEQNKHNRIGECIDKGMGGREAARATGVNTSTVQRAIKLRALVAS